MKKKSARTTQKTSSPAKQLSPFDLNGDYLKLNARQRRITDAFFAAAEKAVSEPSQPDTEADDADDAALLEAARAALRQAGSFTEMHHTVTTVNGTVELLHQMIRPSGEPPDDVNWSVVDDLLEDALRRLGNVYCATAELRQYERDAKGEAADAS